MPTSLPVNSPFKLLQAYKKEDIRIFFGRQRETRILQEALMRSKFMLVYGASGTGKTSLIQCGLQNMYSPLDWLPVLVRRGTNFVDSLYDELYARYLDYYKEYQQQNIEWFEGEVPPPPDKFDTLRDLIKAIFSITYVPVYLILDQFEELFTVGDEAEQNAFFEALQDLHLFDEDLFCKLILITREEYIAHFYRFEKQFPFLFEYRYRVEKMREEQLNQVVEGTLLGNYPGYPHFELEEGTSEQILKNLTDPRGDIDLTTLQVYLDKLYQEGLERLNENESGSEVSTIRFDTALVGENKLENVLADFLNRQVEHVASKLPDQNQSSLPLQILFKLVTSQGTKQNRSAAEIQNELDAGRVGADPGIVALCLQIFSNADSRVLTKLRFANSLEDRYEIVHDRLAEQVFAKFNADEIRQREARTTIVNKKKRFDEAKDFRKKQKLEFLSVGELELVEQSLNLDRLEGDLREFYNNSKLFHENRLRRQLWVTIGSAAAAVVFAIVALFAYTQSQLAKRQSRLAESQKLSAQSARYSAESYIQRSENQIELANLIAIEAIAKQDTLQSEKALVEALNASPHLRQIYYANDKIASVAFSRDGKFIASGSYDSTIQLWSVKEQKTQSDPLKGHTGIVYSIAISPDGHRVASGDANGVIIVWDSQTNKEITRIDGHQGIVWCLSFSPDGQQVYSGGNDQTLRVWDAQTGSIMDTLLNGEHGIIWSINFSPNGEYFAAGLNDHTICIWDAKTGKLKGEPLRGHEGIVYAVGFSVDGRLLVSGSDDLSVRIWDVNTGLPVGKPCLGHKETVWGVALSKNGRQAISASNDKTIRIWDIETGLQIGRELIGHGGPVLGLSTDLERQFVVSGSNDHTVRIWDIKVEGQIGQPLTGHKKTVFRAKFSPNGQQVVSGSEDFTVKLWDVKSGIGQDLPIGHTEAVWGVAFSPDGEYIATASYDLSIRLWNTKTKILRTIKEAHQDWIREIAFSPDGQRVASASSDGTVCLWDVQTLKLIHQYTGHESSVLCVAFSPDGKRLVSSSYDKTIRLWDVEKGTQIGLPLLGHDRAVNSVSFSPDGKLIVSGSEDQTIRFWDAASGQPVGKPIWGTLSQVFSVAFSPNGQQVVSGSEDQTVRVWDVKTNTQIGKPFWGHTGPVRGVSFSPDGQTIVSASEDKTVRFWKFDGTQRVPKALSTSELVEKAQKLVNRTLTDAERKQFIGN